MRSSELENSPDLYELYEKSENARHGGSPSKSRNINQGSNARDTDNERTHVGAPVCFDSLMESTLKSAPQGSTARSGPSSTNRSGAGS
jgi:hypothetical protein